METGGSDTRAGRPRRSLAYWSTAFAIAAAAPLAGHALIAHSIDTRLVPALERATGESVHLGGVDISLFGSVALRDLELGDFISAKRVEGRVALGSMLAGRLSADEIEIREPRIDLRQGGRRLRQLISRLHARRNATPAAPGAAAAASGPVEPAAEPRRRWPNVRVSGGHLRIKTDRGEIAVRGLRARPVGDGLRLITGPVELTGELRGEPLTLDFSRTAADVDTAGGRLARAVALGGRGSWGSIPVDQISVVRDRRGARLRAGISGGVVTAEASGSTARARLAAIPAAALAPLAGSLVLSRGSVSGSISRSGNRLAVALSLDGVTGQLPWLAPDPVDLSSRIDAELALLDGDNPRLDIRRLTVRRGALVARASGVIDAPVHLASAAGQLRLAIDEAPCADIVSSLPPQLSSALRGIRLDGRVAAAVDARFDLGRPVAEALSLAIDLDPTRCLVRGEAPRYLAGLAESVPVDLESLPGHVPAAFLVAEDNRFRQHNGFDRRQIELSLAENVKTGEVRRGGSTITQQLAKNLFLDTRRTVARKLQEAVFAWRLEATHQKSEILARYLGIIQLGLEVRGLEAASQHWFAKPASKLSPREAAFLACLTRAPATLERSIRANGGLGPVLARRVDNLLGSLRFAGAISMSTYRRAMAEELSLAPLSLASSGPESRNRN